MSTFITRGIDQAKAAGPESPRLKRSVGAGDLDQRFTREMRDRPENRAVEARGSASPIRAWRAAEADPSQTQRQSGRAAASATTAAPRQPSGREAGAGSGRSAIERAARMRAIEQAWKEEQARQAEIDDD
jgi:hypothetical protein